MKKITSHLVIFKEAYGIIYFQQNIMQWLCKVVKEKGRKNEWMKKNSLKWRPSPKSSSIRRKKLLQLQIAHNEKSSFSSLCQY